MTGERLRKGNRRRGRRLVYRVEQTDSYGPASQWMSGEEEEQSTDVIDADDIRVTPLTASIRTSKLTNTLIFLIVSWLLFQPKCEYSIRLRSGTDVNQHIERSAPREKKLKVRCTDNHTAATAAISTLARAMIPEKL